jgi:hypothetical protein
MKLILKALLLACATSCLAPPLKKNSKADELAVLYGIE